MLNCGIIGLGGLGKVHFKNLNEMEKKGIGVKLTALCDIDEKRFSEKVNINLGEDKSKIDPAKYSIYTDAEKMLKNEKLDFMNAVAYQRKITIPEMKGKRLILHFGACDYETEVYINGNFVDRHKGGYSSFSFDITRFVSAGECTLTYKK